MQRKFKIYAGFTPILTFCSIGILLTIAMMFNILQIVAYLLYVLGFVSFGYYTFHYFKSNRTEVLLEFPLRLFIVLFGISLLAYGNSYFSAWDEFSFWAVALKELVITDQIYGLNFTDFPEYPRITTLIQYYFNKTIAGNLHEGISISAHVIFSLAFIPMICYKRQKMYLNIILTTIMLFVAYQVLCTPIYFLYADNTIAMLLGSSLAIYFLLEDKNKALLLTAVLLAALTLTKPIGILFSVIGLGCIGLNYLFTSNIREQFLQKIKPLVLAGLIVFGCFGSWKAYISIKNAEPISKTTSQITLENIMNPPAHYDGIRDSFVNAFFFGEQEIGSAVLKPATLQKDLKKYTGINLSFLQDASNINISALFIIALLASIVLFHRKRILSYFPKKYSFIILLTTMLFAIIGYAILLLFIYAFVFYEITQKEAGELASYYRYMGSLLLAFFFFLSILTHNSKRRYTYYAIAVLVFFMMVLPRSFFSNLVQSTPSESVKSRISIGKQIAPFISKEKIQNIAYITYDNIEDISLYHLKYEALPVQTNSEPFTFKQLTTLHTIDELKSKLATYDAIVIKKINAEEIQNYLTTHGFTQKIYVLD
ncbi:hypothetical protein H2O64_10770 [Kordia sp. YSTF-M3]|uniref:Glycosyltransferase RgtA/B/C/D-like domain-containing protein n=1 Tax=Kordia aestuariivivens TaxID=2759037 RepID=A0ABR7Q9B0_9FLAO|nr:hypothetical protein [Kordia aestuariivivens]MBC8755157.1 hypothetical protein [Kordia aestuariivivens]